MQSLQHFKGQALPPICFKETFNYIFRVKLTFPEVRSIIVGRYRQWNEMKWNEMKWNEVKWNEMKWNEVKWSEVRWNEMKWSDSNTFIQIQCNNLIAKHRLRSSWIDGRPMYLNCVSCMEIESSRYCTVLYWQMDREDDDNGYFFIIFIFLKIVFKWYDSWF